MRALAGAAAFLTCCSATLGIFMTFRRDRLVRRAFEAGQVSAAGQVPESIGAKTLRIGAISAFIVLALSIALTFLMSVLTNVGSF